MAFRVDRSRTIITAMIHGRKLTAMDVAWLRREVFASGKVTREAADELFAVERAGLANAPQWTEFFVEMILEHVVWRAAEPGVVAEADAKWLAGRVEECGSANALAALAAVLGEARRAPGLARRLSARSRAALGWPGAEAGQRRPRRLTLMRVKSLDNARVRDLARGGRPPPEDPEMADLSQFPIVKRWPAKRPGRHPALFAADAQRGEGVDRAGGARARLRAASHRHREEREPGPGVPVAEPQRQDPGDHRSRWPGRQAARPVRIGRDPRLSRREDRQAACRPTRRAATRRWNGCSSRWLRSGRCSASSASSTSSPAAKIEDKRPLERYVKESKRLLGRAGDAPDRPRLDHGRGLHDRRHFPARLGAQSRRLLRRGRSRRMVERSRRSRAGWRRRWRARRCSAG